MSDKNLMRLMAFSILLVLILNIYACIESKPCYQRVYQDGLAREWNATEGCLIIENGKWVQE